MEARISLPIGTKARYIYDEWVTGETCILDEITKQKTGIWQSVDGNIFIGDQLLEVFYIPGYVADEQLEEVCW
jgi:hypothetical protein